MAAFAEYCCQCESLVIGMAQLSQGVLTQRAVIAGKLAGRAGSIELNATDTTDFVLRHVPVPGSDGVPFFECDLHCV